MLRSPPTSELLESVSKRALYTVVFSPSPLPQCHAVGFSDTLKWSKDPKPLVEYLRSASLTSKDVNMLRQTQYLPAENDETRTFAPSELFLPGKRVFRDVGARYPRNALFAEQESRVRPQTQICACFLS